MKDLWNLKDSSDACWSGPRTQDREGGPNAPTSLHDLTSKHSKFVDFVEGNSLHGKIFISNIKVNVF
jgi:hypothetical protein